MAKFSAPKRRSLPTSTNVQNIAETLASWQSQLNPVIKNVNPPATPVNFRVTNARGGLQLSWSPVQGADGYEILKSQNGSFTDDLVVIPVSGQNNTSYFDSLGGNAQTTRYRIRTTAGTNNNPQSQRGPESGVVSHTSIDAADTASQPTTALDNYTTDSTRAGARFGNYGTIAPSDTGLAGGSSGAAGPAAGSGSSSSGSASSSGGAVTFDAIGTGENVTANMIVGTGAAIFPDVDRPGMISATHLQGTLIATDAPADGNVLAYSATNGQYDLPTNVFVNPSDSGDILPAASNTTQSLGSASAPWNVEARALNAVLFADAFATLQAAHDALPSNGGKIIVPAGTYAAAGTVLTISKPNVVIEGVGPQSVISGTGASAYPTATNVILVTASNVKIANLAVQGAAVDQSTNQNGICQNSGISRMEVSGVSFSALNVAISMSGSANSVHDNAVGTMFGTSSSTGYGVLLIASSYNSIKNNQITFTSSEGRHQIYVSRQSSYNEVSGNVLRGGTNIQIQVYAFDAQTPGAQYNDVHDNTCLDCAGATGGVISINNNASHNKVHDNVVISSTACYGIAVWDAGGSVLPNDNAITNNYIALAGLAGILVFGANDCLIASNKVYDCSQQVGNTYPGIYLGSDGQTCNNNRILNNFVRGTSHNYALQILAAGTAPSATEVRNNSFDAGTSGSVSDGGSGTVYGVNQIGGSNTLLNTAVTGITGSGKVVLDTSPVLTTPNIGAATGVSFASSGTELLLKETGDSLGAFSLRLRNRSGSNGAVFENPTVCLADFAMSASATITNVAINGGNVLTATAAFASGGSTLPAIGQKVTLSGLTTATFLNGQTVTIASISSTQFTAPFTHAAYASAPDTGTAVAQLNVRAEFRNDHVTSSLNVNGEIQFFEPTASGGSGQAWLSSGQVLTIVGSTNGIQSVGGVNFGGTTLSHYDEGTWVPVAVNLTTVGTPTLSGTYTRVGRLVAFTITIVAGTSTASTTPSTTLTLPFTPGIVSTATAVDSNATDYGVGFISTSGKVFPPTWSATSATMIISGSFQI